MWVHPPPERLPPERWVHWTSPGQVDVCALGVGKASMGWSPLGGEEGLTPPPGVAAVARPDGCIRLRREGEGAGEGFGAAAVEGHRHGSLGRGGHRQQKGNAGTADNRRDATRVHFFNACRSPIHLAGGTGVLTVGSIFPWTQTDQTICPVWGTDC